MTKIIELSRYRKDKLQNSRNSIYTNNPIWFYELNEGIKKLALKDMKVIINNVVKNLLQPYYKKLKTLDVTEFNYSMDSYILDHLNVSEPFSITHEIKFHRTHHLEMISEHDWHNITDIIIRISVIKYYKMSEEVQPIDFVKQYSWTSIKVDLTN